MYHANWIADKPSKIFCMKKSLKDQVESYMSAVGVKAAGMAKMVASFQKDLPAKSQCKRQDIENLLQKDFKTVRYIGALAKAMSTDVETLDSGLYVPPAVREAGAKIVGLGEFTVGRQEVTPLTYFPPAKLGQALRLLGDAIAAADDLSRDQMRPLFERWVREPDRAADIIERLLDILSRSNAPKQERALPG